MTISSTDNTNINYSVNILVCLFANLADSTNKYVDNQISIYTNLYARMPPIF